MRELQIFILDSAGNQLGELDLTGSDDFALKLNKSIATIKDLGRRNTSFSLDFEAQQTKNNYKLLAGLRFATHSKDILGQKPCSILVDGNQIDRGFLYPFASEFDGMYKLVFKGLNNDWVEQLKDVELNQLNWRDWATGLRTVDATEEFSGSRMAVLNAQNSVNTDLTYPYVNRNNGGYAPHQRPQLHLRSIILSMFEKIGYTVSSVFLESDWIKGGVAYTDAQGNPYEHLGLSVDPTFQMTREPQDLISQSIEYSTTGITGADSDPTTWALNTIVGNLGSTTVPNIRTTYRFPAIINTLITDNVSRFNIPTSEFTVGAGGLYSLDFLFKYTWGKEDHGSGWTEYVQGVSPKQKRPPEATWYIVKNNTSDTAIDGVIIWQTPITPTSSGVVTSINSLLNGFISLAPGDKISVFMQITDNAFGFTGSQALLNGKPINPSGSLNRWRLRIKNDSVLTITPKQDVTLGDEFRINSHIPEGIKCMTLLQDFKTMFNLYFDVDVNRKIVFIEPRDDFYTNTFEDITDIIDLKTPPTLNYLTDYKNEIVFKYAVDSKDKYLEQWNKANDKTYAEYKYLLQNNSRFDKGQSVLSTQMLSATIQEELNSQSIMSSIIKEEYLDVDNVGKPVNRNYGARVFQLVRGQQYEPSGVPRRTSSPLVVLTAIMEDYANTPTYEDRKLTFVGTRGLVEDYYAKTLANIEDTAVLTLKIVLGLYEFAAWDLAKTYYISEPAEIAGYYITDSIKNFNVTKETPTTITLVKFKDFTPVAVASGSGNVNVITQTNPQPQEIFCTVNGAIVSCLDNNFQKMYKI